MSRKISFVWEHFVKEGKAAAYCKVEGCSKFVTFGKGTTHLGECSKAVKLPILNFEVNFF